MLQKMKMLGVLLMLVCIGGNSWADELVSLKLGYQVLSPSGSVAGTVNGTGQELNIERDLDLDDSENVTAEAALQWGNSRLSVNYLPIEFSGTGTLSVAGTFNGQSFSIDDTVNSEISIDIYDVGYTHTIWLTWTICRLVFSWVWNWRSRSPMPKLFSRISHRALSNLNL